MGFRIDSDGNIDGTFTDTPAPGQSATKVSADWLNMIQEEFLGFLEANEVVLEKVDNTQFRTLMTSLLAATALLIKIKTVDGHESGLDADLLDGYHASAFASAAQGAKADSALQNATAFATAAQGAKADSASTPVDGGSARLSSGQIKTKIISIALNGVAFVAVSHGISNAYSGHRILGVDFILDSGGDDNLCVYPYLESVYWGDTTMTVRRSTSSGNITLYAIVRYV